MKPRPALRGATPAGPEVPDGRADWRLQVFNVFLFLAGVGGMFFRMARDNDDLVRMCLVLVAGAGATLLLAERLPRLPRGLLPPVLGFAAAAFLACTPLASFNPAESMKEFLKIACYLLVFMTLAEAAELPTGVRRTPALVWTGTAIGAAAVILGAWHRSMIIWTNEQIVTSMIVTFLCCAAYVILLAPGRVRDGVLKGCGVMALLACVLGLLQFYHLDPLRPWDPKQPYNIWIRSGGPDVLNLLAGLTAGQLQVEGNKIILVLPRILGIYGNPDFFAPYLLQFIPLFGVPVLLARGGAGWWRATGLTAFLLVTLFLTAVWGAFFALFITALLMAPLLGYVTGRLDERRAIHATAVLLAGGALVLLLASWALHATGTKSHAINERLVKLRMAAEMWRREPLTGVGLNAYKSWYPALEQEVRLKHNLPFESLGSSFTQENRTHNDHAQMLAETGVLGFGMFCWLIVTLGAVALARCREWRSMAPEDLARLAGLFGGVLVVLVYALPNFPFHIVSSAGTFWIMAGLLASYSSIRGVQVNSEQTTTAGTTRPNPLLTAAAALTILAMAIFSVRLFVGTLEYKRADNLSRMMSPSNPHEAAIHYQTALDLDPVNAQYHYDYGAMCFNAMATVPDLGRRAGPLLERALELGFLNEDLAYGLAHVTERDAANPPPPPGQDVARPEPPLPPDTVEQRARAMAILRAHDPFDVVPPAHALPLRARALLWYSLATKLNERHEPSRRGRLAMFQSECLAAETAKAARKWKPARDLYAEALKRNPENFYAAMNLGTLTVTPFGDAAAGVAILARAARNAVNEPNAWLALGRGEASIGRYKESRAALLKAAALDPKSGEIQAALASLDAVEQGHAPAPGTIPPAH